MNFGSVLTAMVTPFDSKGNIDYEKTTDLVEHLLNNGTDGLVVAGTTGESPTLTEDEKINLFAHVVNVVDKRVPVIAGTGSNNTAASIALTKKAQNCGVDGIMLVAPYYNKPNQLGMYEHFKTIAGVTSLPVILYDIPGRSVVTISAETIIKLSEIDNIVSVKAASGDLDQIAEIVERTDDNFSVYSGEDSITLPMLSIGAIGVISVASHVVGKELNEMVHAFHNGEVKKAAAIHRQILPVMKALFMAPSPSPVKAALHMKGVDTGSVRLPLVPLSDAEQQQLNERMER
ncbi:4-hydroxy-tetrahydrodipicolinate synthase [Lentibacillus sp. N15]|uniref:4-hydroxy-tetrahydrodipicolinate synthase n=1 Tax=Lentibacillus songyuanensis TaxID=3136161 RepID=UPI0031BAC3F2